MTIENVMGTAGAAVGAVLVAVLSFKRWSKSMTEIGAETGLVQRLQGEITRLSEQNERLATMLNELQTDFFTLRSEHAAIRRENDEFRHMLGEAGLLPPDFAQSRGSDFQNSKPGK